MGNLLKKINDKILKENINEILREDRNKLRDEKKRAWSPKRTRAPFYFRARGNSKINSFHDALELAKKIIDKMGSPWKSTKRGRPPDYCPKKLAISSLVKHYFSLSFDVLRAKLIEINFDCRVNDKKKKVPPVPSKSELHWALEKIPSKFLQEGMRLIDDWSLERHKEIFGTDELNMFGVDGTESTCVELEEFVYGGKDSLRRTTDQVNVLVRLVTNTICEVNSSKKENLKDLTKLLKKRKKSKRDIKNLEIYGDGAYDGENNYEITYLNDTELIVKPNKLSEQKTRGFYRKKGHSNFSTIKYKNRKKVERPFGNMYLRDGNKIWYKRPDMKEKGELLRCIAHNMRAYFMQDAWGMVFEKLSK